VPLLNTKPILVKRVQSTFLAVAVLAVTLGGCVGIPAQPRAGSDTPGMQVAGLSEDLIYEYLLGSVAARRGEGETAASAMFRAAQLSENADITLQAFSLSMDAGLYEQALELSDLMGKIDPDGPPERRLTMRLQALIALEQEDGVFDTLVSLVEILPEGESELMTFVAQTLGRQSDPGRWIELMTRFADYFDSRPSAQIALAWFGYRTGEVAIAEEAMSRAMALRPGWEDAAMLKLSHLREQGDNEAASAYVIAFLEAFPDRSRLRLTYGRFLAEQNDNIAALAQFEKLLEYEPQNIDARYAAGVLSQNLADLPAARGHFEAILGAQPNEDRARLYLGQILSELGDTEAALDLLGEVADPELYFDAQIRIGFVLADAKRVDEALSHLSDLTPKSQDDQVRMYLAREQVLRESDQAEKALSLLNAALIDIPDHPDLLYSRGLVTALLDRIEDHERDMRRLIEMEPDNPHAYNALGYTLADKTDRLAEAQELIEKALALLPGDPFILDSLGWVHYRRGELEVALEYLQMAMEQQPDAEIAAHLGEVLWTLGQKDQAVLIWQDGQRNNPENAVLIETLRKFGQ
jgi:tetratricopeptide (TPR) repeat protein